MPTLNAVALKIIKEQELVIGPLAWTEAKKVEGLNADQSKSMVSISGDAKVAVDRLVNQYERLFGPASQQVCREAAASIIASMQPSEVPASLRA